MATKNNDFAQRPHHGTPTAPHGWVTTRKYNGVSCVWIPCTRDDYAGVSGLWTLGRTSGRKSMPAPLFFLDSLPVNIALHGELWHESDQLEKSLSAIRNSALPIWHEMNFVAFAFPANNADNIESKTPYRTARQNAERAKIENDIVSIAAVLPVGTCPILNGWEGVIFQNPSSGYTHGRTLNTLKYKSSYDECHVIDHTKNGLKCLWTITEKTKTVYGFNSSLKIGQKIGFSISCAGFLPSIGSEISFDFMGLIAKGQPISPEFLRVIESKEKRFSLFGMLNTLFLNR